MTVHGLILAGGRGSRLGDVRKRDLRLGGTTLLDRVSARLLPGVERLLVATGPGAAPALRTGIAVADSGPDFGGPMAGLRAALDYLRDVAGPEDVLVTAAVDSPLLPDDYVSKMTASLDEGRLASQAAWGDSVYPTQAAWRLSALLALTPGALPDSPRALLESLGAGRVDWSGEAAENPFANLNTLEDLMALARRVR